MGAARREAVWAARGLRWGRVRAPGRGTEGRAGVSVEEGGSGGGEDDGDGKALGGSGGGGNEDGFEDEDAYGARDEPLHLEHNPTMTAAAQVARRAKLPALLAGLVLALQTAPPLVLGLAAVLGGAALAVVLAVALARAVADGHTLAGLNGKQRLSRPQSFLFAAGGTGGHVYPAIAVADALRELSPGASITFVGSPDRLEAKAVPEAGYDFEVVPATGLRRPLWRHASNLKVPGQVLRSVWRVIFVFLEKRPTCVIGTGGYVSVPTGFAAWIMGVPLLLHESNAYAGLANRFLGKVATRVHIAFEQVEKYFPPGRCVMSGNPTRAALASARREDALRYFCIEDGAGGSRPEVLVVMGGSLGAHVINLAMEHSVPVLLKNNPNLYIVWQTGTEYYDGMYEGLRARYKQYILIQRRLAAAEDENSEFSRMRREALKAYEEGDFDAGAGAAPLHPRLRVLPYIKRMEHAYAASDLVVCRSGAITCSEILVTGKPCVLIPSPNVTDNHQTKNSMAMETKGASIMLRETALSKTVTGKRLKLAVPVEEPPVVADEPEAAVSRAAADIVPATSESAKTKSPAAPPPRYISTTLDEDDVQDLVLVQLVQHILDDGEMRAHMSKAALKASTPLAAKSIALDAVRLSAALTRV